MSSITPEEIDAWFGYHPASDEQKQSYKRIEDKAKELASLMVEVCPSSADLSAAIRLLREAKMTAIAAIATTAVLQKGPTP